ncbi:cell division protein FtsL [Caminicella sporogenes DSM 14501]|uniref:Cell division protein FtsL n=1 Tax=Caminicella sporogenes DSM 14501 TaxID=1121266 RepID=A0A1M6L0S5_9FIRM|nr:hypothetical protein [Caminicella sporogenes]RKD27665.1 hypothetical protein BET04_00950 [Caminicella sporogenes]SHJ64787.1 cell division protein FtsL [Caminicella sporogenes DSM 14501]
MLVAKKKYHYDYNIDKNFKLNSDKPESNKKASKNTRKDTIRKVNAIVYVLLVSLIFFLILYRHAHISETKYRINVLNRQINKLERELQDLKAEFDRKTRSEIIEQKAIKELHMQYPQYSQIVFLTVDDNLDLSSTDEKNINAKLDQKDKQSNKKFSYLKKTLKKLYSLLD